MYIYIYVYVNECICESNKTFENDEYLDIENCSYEKRLLGKLVLACGDEILYN